MFAALPAKGRVTSERTLVSAPEAARTSPRTRWAGRPNDLSFGGHVPVAHSRLTVSVCLFSFTFLSSTFFFSPPPFIYCSALPFAHVLAYAFLFAFTRVMPRRQACRELCAQWQFYLVKARRLDKVGGLFLFAPLEGWGLFLFCPCRMLVVP